jgi:hypothetical protein
MGLDYRGGILFVIAAIVTHYIDIALNQFDPFLAKIGTLSIIDLILIAIGLSGLGIIIYDGLKRLRAKQRPPTEQRQRQLTQHCNILIMEYNRYISDYIKIADISLEGYLSRFKYWKQFRQHLYTGHRELYDLIGQNNYHLFIERMGEDLLNGIALETQTFGGVCDDCLNLHYEREIPQLQLLLNQLH